MGTPGSPPTRLMAVPDKWVRPTRRPADLSVGPTDLVGSPHDLLKTFQKTPRRPSSSRPQDLAYKTRQDLGGLRPKQIDGIWQDVCRLRSRSRKRPGVWEPTSSAGQYKVDEATLVPHLNQSSSNLHRQLDVGYYSPEARTSINSPCSLCSAYSCATFEFLALDSSTPNK
jgi:hypothetical protein